MADYLKVLASIKEALKSIIEEIDKVLPSEKEKSISEPEPSRVIVSCDGSILKNPGGRSTIGAVIQVPGNDPVEVCQFTPATTNNEAEFDAVYVGLSNALILAPSKFEIVVESDSKLIIDSLNGECSLKETRLIKKRDLILEVAVTSLSPVSFAWRRRNSTSGLRRANNMAQELNGVKPH